MATNILRGHCAPSNVVRLPTAAARKVVQRSAAAAREYRASQPSWPGGRCMHKPEAEALALCSHRSPALLIAMAILNALPPEQREAAQNAVYKLDFLAAEPVSGLTAQLVARVGRIVS